MPDYTTTAPAEIPLTVSAFLRMFGQGGVTPNATFTGTEEATHEFTTPFAGTLEAVYPHPTDPIDPRESLQADIDGFQYIGYTAWKNYGVIAKGIVIRIRVDAAYIDLPVANVANFQAAPETIPLTVTGFTVSPPTEIPLSPIPATAAYSGSSVLAISNGAGVTANLTVDLTPDIPGTYLLPAGGYKYFAIPASQPALTILRDNATNFTVPLAGAPDGYDQTANGLTFRLVTVSGAPYRLYRSANTLGGAVTIYVA